jgi:hypothetical protein
MPVEFIQIYQYANSLNFEEKPDYNFLYGLLNKTCSDYSITADNNFMWVTQRRRRNNKSELDMKREESSTPIRFDCPEDKDKVKLRPKKFSESVFDIHVNLNEEENQESPSPSPFLGSRFLDMRRVSDASGSHFRSLAPHGSFQGDETSNITAENILPEFSERTFELVRSLRRAERKGTASCILM